MEKRFIEEIFLPKHEFFEIKKRIDITTDLLKQGKDCEEDWNEVLIMLDNIVGPYVSEAKVEKEGIKVRKGYDELYILKPNN